MRRSHDDSIVFGSVCGTSLQAVRNEHLLFVLRTTDRRLRHGDESERERVSLRMFRVLQMPTQVGKNIMSSGMLQLFGAFKFWMRGSCLALLAYKAE